MNNVWNCFWFEAPLWGRYEGRFRNKIPKELQPQGIVRGEIQQHRWAVPTLMSPTASLNWAAHSWLSSRPRWMFPLLINQVRDSFRNSFQLLCNSKKIQASYPELPVKMTDSRCRVASRQQPTWRLPPNTRTFDTFGCTVMFHPPYSLDFAPSDYLFPKFKEHLNGQRFRSVDDVKEEVKHFLNGLASEFYDIGIQKLEHRLQKLIVKDGNYVEKKSKLSSFQRCKFL